MHLEGAVSNGTMMRHDPNPRNLDEHARKNDERISRGVAGWACMEWGGRLNHERLVNEEGTEDPELLF